MQSQIPAFCFLKGTKGFSMERCVFLGTGPWAPMLGGGLSVPPIEFSVPPIENSIPGVVAPKGGVVAEARRLAR